MNLFMGFLLAVTATITVGVDFSRSYFNRAYMYCSSFGSIIRDSIQGILRVRSLIDRKLFINVCSLKNTKCINKTIHQIEKFQEYKSNYYKELISQNSVSKQFEKVPKWVITNKID